MSGERLMTLMAPEYMDKDRYISHHRGLDSSKTYEFHEESFTELVRSQFSQKIAGPRVRVQGNSEDLKWTQALAVANRGSGTLLFVSGEGILSVWALQNGTIESSGTSIVTPEGGSCPPPL